jgi:long-chain acyl-CoA synthetase
VREFTNPSSGEPTVHSAAQYLFDNAERRPDHVALKVRDGEQWQPVTTSEFAARVVTTAKGLIAAGVQHGERVALMSKTRYEWTLFDFAFLSIGAVVIPIYETSSAEQVRWILSDSAATWVVLETDYHADILNGIRADLPAVRSVWQIDRNAVAELAEAGAAIPDEMVTLRRNAVGLADIASVIYTSGTTGRPKGCILTHRNFVAEVDEVCSGLTDLFNSETSTLLFLPIAHVLGRVIQLGAIAQGTTLGHTADIRNLVGELAGFRPSFLLSVPRVFEKVHSTARQRAHSEGRGRIYDLAERIAIEYSQALDGHGPGVALRLKHRLFDRVVYSKLRAALGGRCEAAICGGAPLGVRLGHFFRGIGITVYEGYGLTETTAAACVNLQNRIKIGTVGRPIAGMSARIADDGEIMLSGPVVFAGYWHNDQATEEAVDTVDGKSWFHTGDIGEIDDDGYVRVTGRKKELIVTAGGKNVAPSVLEDRVRAHWLVGQCLVVGDQKPFIAALVTIDPDAWPTWLANNGRRAETSLAESVQDESLVAEIQTVVDDANKAVSHAESIRKFTILPEDWTEAGGQLTPSLKVKRNVVLKQQSAEIAALYSTARGQAES